MLNCSSANLNSLYVTSQLYTEWQAKFIQCDSIGNYFIPGTKIQICMQEALLAIKASHEW